MKSQSRLFSHHYPIPHDGGSIDIEVCIQYIAFNWGIHYEGGIDVVNAWISSFKFIKLDMTRPTPKVGEMVYERYPWHKAVMSDSEAKSAKAWLEQTPLDFFYDAAFKYECEEWDRIPLQSSTLTQKTI